jgi:hypothetical protein
MEKSTGPLEFTASFPRDARFAPTAGELAAKLAQTTGCAERAAQELRDAVSAAFQAVLAETAGDSDAAVGLVLHAGDASFATEVTCGARSFLRLTHPRPAA